METLLRMKKNKKKSQKCAAMLTNLAGTKLGINIAKPSLKVGLRSNE